MTNSYALQVEANGTLRTLTLQDLVDVFTEALGGIDIKLGDIDLNTDGIEALATALNTYVDNLEGSTDGLEGLATTLNGLVTTLSGYVDGLEALQTSSNTKLDQLHTDLATTLGGMVDGLEGLATTLNSYVDGLEAGQTSSNTKLDQLHTDIATTLIGLLPTALSAGRLKTEITQAAGTVLSVDSGATTRTAKGYYQGTVSNAAVTLATVIGTSIPTGAKYAIVSFSTAVRYRDDGTNPTAAVGFPVTANTPWKFDEADFSTLKFIRQSADATTDVAFYA